MMNRPIAVTTAVILAGGLSRRMFDAAPGDAARDKGLLDLGRESMLARVVRRIAPQVGNVVLNANGAPERFGQFQLPVVADPVGGYVGPLAGILAGMNWAAANDPDATHIVTVSSDVPFLPTDLVERLAARAATHPDAIVLAASGGEVHSVIGCWPLSHARDLETCLLAGDRKVITWAGRHGIETVAFEKIAVGSETVDPFFNANTPAELAEARRLIAGETDAL